MHFGRRDVFHQAAGGRQEAAERVFGIDPTFHGPAVEPDLVLAEGQLLAGGDANHELHQIHPGDQFGHRVLDLQARVHFQEIEALVLADHELDGARALVVHRLGQRHRLLAHGLARRGIDEGRGRLFDHLLVAALQGAFALMQIDRVAVRIADQLDLDVARLLDELLDKDAVVAESVLRLGLAGGEALGRFLVVVGHAQALAAAAGRRLDHHRIADALRDLDRLLRRVDGGVMAGNGIDPGFQRQLLRGNLVAHRGHRVVLGPDENDAALFQPTRELRVLRQEAIARMHGLGAGLLAGGNDLVDGQIGFLRGRRADADRFIGHAHVHGVLVRLGIHGDGGDAHLARGLDDAAGNLSAICNKYLFEHAMSSVQRQVLADLARGVQGGKEIRDETVLMHGEERMTKPTQQSTMPNSVRAECCRACATGS
jgi:hypothetical protein